MSRGRRKKSVLNLKAVTPNISPDVFKSIIALLLFLTAGITLISFFAGDQLLNSKIQSALRGTFGVSSYLVPFVVFFLALFFVEIISFRYKKFTVLIGLIALVVLLSVTGALMAGKADSGGGILGYTISNFFEDSISVYGTVLVLLFGYMLSFVLIFDLTLNHIFGILKKILSGLAHLVSLIKLPKFEKAVPVAENLVISTGTQIMDANENFMGADLMQNLIDKKVIKAKHEKTPEKFEIIPSMAEPQNVAKEEFDIKESADMLTSLAPGSLPYSDKVWETPPLELLSDTPIINIEQGDVQVKAKIIKDTLRAFGITVTVAEIQQGPSVTQYALEADIGTKSSRIVQLQNDLAMALASPTGTVRIEAPIPGKSLIGIEVPNNTRVPIHFKSLLTSDAMRAAKSKLSIVMGKNVAGQSIIYDIGKMPHLLLAGATGSGKSVFIHNVLFSLLYRASPQEVKLILIDPKRVEMVYYHDIPHLYVPVVTDLDKAPSVFKWAVFEMERRYKLFESAKVRNIDGYNEKSGFQALPYLVIVCDELAEIMIIDPATVEKNIVRIAQLARATGIHLVLATQRPSTNVISGLIKANVPCRVAFGVTSQIDSRVIIDQPGAEKLLGKGDMLFVPPDVQKPIRLQASYISDREINNLVTWLKNTGIKPDYRDEVFSMPADNGNRGTKTNGEGENVDELFAQAVDVVTSAGKASTSLLQRRLSIGYARAARIMDEMEEKGIIASAASGSKYREILSGTGVGKHDNLTGVIESDEYYEPPERD